MASRLAALLGEGAAPACVPSALVVSTVMAASFAAARGAAGKRVLSSTVAVLTEGVLKSMLLSKLKSAITMLVVSSVVTLSAGAVISGIRATEPAGGLADGQERGPANTDQLEEQMVELKDQLQHMQKKVVLLEQAAVHLQALRQRIPPKAFDAFLANRFQYRIPFEIGSTENHEGGRIEIQEVWGTRSRIEVGGQYLVRGKYVLPPGERGRLYFGERAEAVATDDLDQLKLAGTAIPFPYIEARRAQAARGGIHTLMDLESIALNKERGEFALLHGMEGPGYFHLHLTDAERYSRTFANVFFGTGNNVWRGKP